MAEKDKNPSPKLAAQIFADVGKHLVHILQCFEGFYDILAAMKQMEKKIIEE